MADCCTFLKSDKYGRDITIGTRIFNMKDCHCGEVVCIDDCVKIEFTGGAVKDFDQYFNLHGKHIKVTQNDKACYDKTCEERCQDLTC